MAVLSKRNVRKRLFRNLGSSRYLPLLLLTVVTVLAYLLAMLEAALCRGTVLRAVALLVSVTLLASIALLAVLLRRLLVSLLLVAALVVPTLWRVRAVALWWILLLLAVALVVLIISRHVTRLRTRYEYRSIGAVLYLCVL